MKAAIQHPGLSRNVAALLEVARGNPWWEFEGEEIAAMMNLPANTIAMLKRSPDSPFKGGRSRPERVAAFFASHPGWRPSAER